MRRAEILLLKICSNILLNVVELEEAKQRAKQLNRKSLLESHKAPQAVETNSQPLRLFYLFVWLQILRILFLHYLMILNT